MTFLDFDCEFVCCFLRLLKECTGNVSVECYGVGV